NLRTLAPESFLRWLLVHREGERALAARVSGSAAKVSLVVVGAGHDDPVGGGAGHVHVVQLALVTAPGVTPAVGTGGTEGDDVEVAEAEVRQDWPAHAVGIEIVAHDVDVASLVHTDRLVLVPI